MKEIRGELTREGHRALEEIIFDSVPRAEPMGDRQVFSVAYRIQKDYRPSYLPSSRDHKRPPRQRRRPYDATEQAIKLL
jgi:hypothetical protein